MIKKYYVEKDSPYNISLVMPFYEEGIFGFDIDGLSLSERHKLFDYKIIKTKGKNKEIDVNSLPTSVAVTYYKEENNSRKLYRIIFQSNDGYYYGFRVDDRDDTKLIFQTNYKLKSLEELESIFDKRVKDKKQKITDFIGNFVLLRNIDFYEDKYFDFTNKQLDYNANTSRLIFNENNKYTADFIRLIEQGRLHIRNSESFAKHILNRDMMANLRNNRKDCLLINFDVGNIEYFIYTYRPRFINHYLLFKNLGNNQYRFIVEDTSFNKLFSSEELKNLKYKHRNQLDAERLSEMSYEEFFLRYYEFENDEEFDENIEDEQRLYDSLEEEVNETKQILSIELHDLLNKFGYQLQDNFIVFPNFESIPLAILGKDFIKIKHNRNFKDVSFTNQISLKDLDTINSLLTKLLYEEPSSRLLSFDKTINRIIKIEFDNKNDNHYKLIDDVENIHKDLWDTDRKYPIHYLDDIYQPFLEWKKDELPRVLRDIKADENTLDKYNDVCISIHASQRIDERIKKMDEKDKLKLAVDAYSRGETAAHYIEKDFRMFAYLSQKQNTYVGKTLRLYQGFIFIFALSSPHKLVTCFPLNQDYEKYLKHFKK